MGWARGAARPPDPRTSGGDRSGSGDEQLGGAHEGAGAAPEGVRADEQIERVRVLGVLPHAPDEPRVDPDGVCLLYTSDAADE